VNDAPFYISNDGDATLAGLLSRAVTTDPSGLDVAVGYFKPDVWQLVGQVFDKLQALRLLIGAEPRIEGDDKGLNLADYFARQMRGDLEEMVFDHAWAALMDELIDFLRRESVDVRLFQKIPDWHAPFLHAKAYIFPSITVVGSSNLTPAGLTKNVELNLVRTDEAAANELRRWFDSRWEHSADYKDDLIRALEESKFGDHPWTPYQVFIKALYEYFKDRLGPEEAVPIAGEPLDLAKFQWDGVIDAKALLDRYRGCVVADATGLGKTHIGLELMREYFLKIAQRVRRPRFLVVCPAQLRELVWRPRIREYLGFNVDIESMEALGQDTFDPRKYIDHDFVLVDEGHNFRHPSPRRYENLMTVVGTGKSDKYVALLTATPINTSIFDLYHQIMLLARNRDDFFLVDGIASLIGYFKRVAKESLGLFDIIQRTTVRRTRFDIRRRQQQGEVIKIGDEEVRFPHQPPPEPVLYDLTASYGGFYQEVVHAIEDLHLAAYRLDSYRRASGVTEETVKSAQREDALAGIFKTVFLKRLESSVHAFRRSIQDQVEFQRAFLQRLHQGKLLGASEFRRIRKLLQSEDDEQQERAQEVIEALDEVDTAEYDLARIEAEVEADATALSNILERLNELAAEGAPDPKLDSVKAFIRLSLDGRLRDRKLLIFSYFRETAEYIFRALSADDEWLKELDYPRMALISGSTDGERRKDLVQRFSPVSNKPEGADDDWKPADEPLDILISTDVLSEGQNLQDCGELLNYDLHWNPVRMIQRAGRINRLKALHEEVHVYNCFPDKELEDLLRIVRRLQARIQDIDQSVGLDASVLGEAISEKSFEQLERIRRQDASVVDELEQQAELVTLEDMKVPLQAFMTEEGKEALEKIPLGIRSAKEGAAKGTFFAFKAAGTEGRDFHYWRLYPDDGRPPITEMRQIFNVIRCNEKDTRVSVPDPNRPNRQNRRLDMVEQATADILKELRGQKGVATKPYEMRVDERRFWQAVKNPQLGEEIDDELRARVLAGLEHGIFAPVRIYHEWKDLAREWRAGGRDTAWLAAKLDELAVTWSLYSGSEFGPIGALKSVTEENLRLVCYELVV
jgi:superfamily II DNA or RNA helicase